MAIKRIPVSKLRLGMYVSRLDRPWRETPFLFQGFYVEDDDELNALRRLCRHVFIVSPDERPVQRPSAEGIDVAELDLDDVLELQMQDARAESEVPFVEEVDSAKKYHADLTEFARDVWTGIQQGRVMDAERLRESVSVMVDSISRNPDAFVWLARVKDYDSYTYAHAVNVAAWCTLFGRKLGFPEKSLEDVAAGGLFLDIGNIKLPKQVLEKPDRLTDDEWQLVKTHVGHSVDLLQATEGIPESMVQMVATHHERYDGSGYPRGLEGDEIPLYGQMAGIVDFYVSVTFPRPAGRAVSSDFALNVLFKQRNRFFKSELVDQFIRVIGLYPSGSLVELTTGEVAIVLCQHPTRRLRPRVMLVLDADKQPYESYPIVDLVKETEDRHGRALAIRRGVRDGEYRIDLSRLPF